MGLGVASVQEKIKSFKRKYYLNLFIRGTILSASILLGYFLVISLLEHNLWLPSWARFVIVFSFVSIAVFCVYNFLRAPLAWFIVRRGLSEEESARIIGSRLSTINDRLLNLIQLYGYGKNDALAIASINQRAAELEPVSFDAVIDLQENKKYLRYLAIPVLCLFTVMVLNRSIIVDSTNRLVNFNVHYSPKAPFDFVIKNSSLKAFYNEDFQLSVQLKGEAIPQNVYLVSKQHRYKLERVQNNLFSYTFENIQQPLVFQLEGAGYFSEEFSIELFNRPELEQFMVELEYPRYLQRKPDQLANSGNIEIPEGTMVRWKVRTGYAERALINFSSLSDSLIQMQRIDNQMFTSERLFVNSDFYSILLENNAAKNKDKIAYSIDVVKDQFPSIVVNSMRDSVLYKRILLGGVISDDYGLNNLYLHFNIRDENQREFVKASHPIPIARNQLQQNFYFNWSLDSLSLKPGSQIEYFLQVWDNDGVNGKKSTKTGVYTFNVPTEEKLVADIASSQSKAEEKIDKSVGKAKKLQDQINQANQKLKGKQSLNWQDKKMLEDIVDQKNQLSKMLEELKEQNKLLEDKKEAFTKQDEKIKEKAQQIQKLMDELLDEETKKLFDELQKLLKENTDVSEMQKVLNKLDQNAENLEKELERTLQLFKELQYDYKLDQAIQDVNSQIEKQSSLMEKTNELDKKSSSRLDKNQAQENEETAKELAEEQEKLRNAAHKTKEKIEELKKLSEELHKNEALPDENEVDQIEKSQEESQELLEQNKPGKAKQAQQQSLEKMKSMQQKMQQMQSSMSMEMDMQNLESLRQIIHGLVKLSFDQEHLLKSLGELSQNDPRFNKLAVDQLKLKDNAKVIEDSLLALGKRDPFMGSVVTKEVTALNNHLDKVIDANKERRRPQALSEMQSSMTSINNLALMLDSHFDMMMEMMAKAQPSMKKSKQKGEKPNLSQLQQQLNQKIQQLKNSGKSGRELSEELAEMAAEQERIRKAFQEMQEKLKEGGGKLPGDVPGKMEQTETELVNKQLTDQLIKRQQEILTRLLETEKSQREQDQDEERKGETAKDYEKNIPKAFEDYLKLREKEVELLRTVPTKLYPYYKREVADYFKRVGNQ